MLIVTDPTLMRSFDYRCTRGIALFIGRQLDSQRAVLQAAGRTNRYSDEASPRFVDTRYRGNLILKADAFDKIDQRMARLTQKHLSQNQNSIDGFYNNAK